MAILRSLAGSARLARDRARLLAHASACAAAALALSACLSDEPAFRTYPGANYLAPGSSARSCTEFTEFDFPGGAEQPSRWFQVFMQKDDSGKVRVGEEVYNRLASREGYAGIFEFTLDPRVPSESDSLEFTSALYILYHSRYRDLAEMRRTAVEKIPLQGLIPPDNSSRVGFAAPLRYGTLALDTGLVLIQGDKDNTEYGYGMVFRKNGEAALTYRFRKNSASADTLLWLIRETRRPCDTIFYAPDWWAGFR